MPAAIVDYRPDPEAAFAKARAAPALRHIEPLLAELTRDAARARAEWMSADTNSLVEAMHEIERRQGDRRQSLAMAGLEQAPEETAAYAAEMDRARATLMEGQKHAAAKSQASAVTREIEDAPLVFLAQANWSTLRHEPAPAVSADPEKALAKAVTDVAAEDEKIAAIARAPKPMQVVLGKALGQLDRARGGGAMPKVNRDGTLEWPTHAVDSRGSGWTQPFAFDARAFWLHDEANYQAAVAHIEAAVAARYARLPEPMDDAQKSKATEAAEARKLVAQRREVAAVRALRAAGRSVPFRPGTSPLALLEIAVVEAKEPKKGGVLAALLGGKAA